MQRAKSYKGVLKQFAALSPEVQNYLPHLSTLLKDYPFEVSLGYVFGRLERAHNMTLYCGVVKLHKANAEVARNALQHKHLTRENFPTLFENIFGKALDPTVTKLLKDAEKVRDRVLHGKEPRPPEIRDAICQVLEYAVAFNDFVSGLAGFKPFNSLTGFKGAAHALDKTTTRWLLKGLGLSLG